MSWLLVLRNADCRLRNIGRIRNQSVLRSQSVLRNPQSALRNPQSAMPLFLEPYPVRALFDRAALLRVEHLVRHPVELFQHDRFAAHAGHERQEDRKSTRLNSSHVEISYAV